MTPDLFSSINEPAGDRPAERPEDLFPIKGDCEYMHALLGDYRDEGRDSYRMFLQEAEAWAARKLERLDRLVPLLEGRDPYLMELNRRRYAAVTRALEQHTRRRAQNGPQEARSPAAPYQVSRTRDDAAQGTPGALNDIPRTYTPQAQ